MAKVLDEINFFGIADRKGKKAGEPLASTYPSFYFHTQIDDLKEEVARQERQVERGLVPATELPFAKADIDRGKKRLQEMEDAHPRLSDAQKDAVYGVYKELQESISDSMFTRSEMKKGLADAHEEARRMSEPIIPIKGMEKFFHNMGITAKDGKVSRNDASRAYKIIGKALGENTNVERLRKDNKTGTFSMEKTLQEMLRG